MKIGRYFVMSLILAWSLSMALAGCDSFTGQDGAPGARGMAGADGATGEPGDMIVPCDGCINISSTDIASGSVTGGDTGQIGSYEITGYNVDSNAIETRHILNSSITTDKLFPGCVVDSKIADLAVTEAKLNIGAVTTNKLANDSVTSAKIVNGQVADEDIGSISGSKILVGTLNGDSALKVGSVSDSKLATGIDGDKILFDTGLDADIQVNNINFTNGSIKSEWIDYFSDPIPGYAIEDGTIPASKLELGALTKIYQREGSGTLQYPGGWGTWYDMPDMVVSRNFMGPSALLITFTMGFYSQGIDEEIGVRMYIYDGSTLKATVQTRAHQDQDDYYVYVGGSWHFVSPITLTYAIQLDDTGASHTVKIVPQWMVRQGPYRSVVYNVQNTAESGIRKMMVTEYLQGQVLPL